MSDSRFSSTRRHSNRHPGGTFFSNQGPLWLALVAMIAVVAAACGRTPPLLLDGEQSGPGGNGGSGAGSAVGGNGANGGSGGSPGCTNDFDCDDDDPCTTDRCDPNGFCSSFDRDEDGDTFVDVLCGGTDCNDLNPNTNPGAPEVCADGDDNNCNGVTDCVDPACANVPNCACVPAPGGENCSDGLDNDCDTTVDCNDADCIGTPACGCAPNETSCEDGIDNDCDMAIDCDDSECAQDPNCGCQASPEVCGDGQDNDCDLLVDCADPNCTGIGPCACQPPGTPELCGDGLDNDCDAEVDCADGDCAAAPECQMCSPENCSDGLDNDCDNMIDCADDSCSFDPACAPTPEVCNNQLDDDNDGFTDCADPDCANNPLCAQQQGNCNTARIIAGSGNFQFTGDTTGNIGEHTGVCGGNGPGEAIFSFTLSQPSRVHLDTIGSQFDSVLYVRFGSCENGSEVGCDDDGGANQNAARIDFTILYPGTYFIFVDGFTTDPVLGPNEGPYVLNVEIEPNPPELCGDGLDNDGDVYVDCADSDCTNVGACLNCNGGNPPGPEIGIGACTDGQDNDCDGVADCQDDDCSASPYAVVECCNGQDQNDNGIPDDFSCRCVSDADCSGGEICYTHTTRTCGFPCDNFFGTICPAIALGSFCSPVTLQCEF